MISSHPDIKIKYEKNKIEKQVEINYIKYSYDCKSSQKPNK